MKPIKEEEYKDKVIRILPDEMPIDPRSYDNLGTMVCSHKRYELGDEQIDTSEFSSVEEIREYLYSERDAEILLPLYLYDHSGITMSTTSFRSHWDSGRVGFIFATEDDILTMYQKDELTDELRDKARESLKDEVELYDMYISGQVFIFSVVDIHQCSECGITHEEVEHSVGGFYDIDDAMDEAKLYIDNH